MGRLDLYHEGELQVQAKSGLTQEAQMVAGAIQSYIHPGAASFIGQQATAVLGSLDANGRVWASVVFGAPGFMVAVDGRSLTIQRSACYAAAGDPLWSNLETNPQLGMLLIELTSRRRLRINGVARFSMKGDCLIDVQRAYANCPKYIQRRRLSFPDGVDCRLSNDWLEGRELDAAQQALVGQADTFFVSSAHPEQGVDASHRGGHPGFVQVLNPHRLRIPDFVGNNMFNTLGNFVSYPYAGLVFIDFDRGRALQLSGRPKVLLHESDKRGETGGTARYWEFEIEAWRESELPLRVEWKFLDYSPHIPTASTSDKEAGRASLPLRVERSWMETGQVKGFHLVTVDGAELPRFEAGSHLPVMVCNSAGHWVERHYSLLSDPAERTYFRIGVRLDPQGRGGSRYLHESVQTGDLLQTMPPRNAFPLVADADHSILLAGGIGITPLLAMLHELKATNRSFELHYSVRTPADLAFGREIRSLAGNRARFYTSGKAYGSPLDLRRILHRPIANTHVYVCGPRRMILAVRELARENGWPQEQIHFESFGAASQPHDRKITVELARSGLKLSVAASRSILDTLLEQGVAVPHECKRGECSLCATRVLAGEPEHRDLCLNPEEQADSMCICVSRAKSGKLRLDL
jgi:ferredoxin-NADP reductase/predicted pyridoxine 5'-phosphate oxidase superfamily flavin-nucleotide-binding protein